VGNHGGADRGGSTGGGQLGLGESWNYPTVKLWGGGGGGVSCRGGAGGVHAGVVVFPPHNSKSGCPNKTKVGGGLAFCLWCGTNTNKHPNSGGGGGVVGVGRGVGF